MGYNGSQGNLCGDGSVTPSQRSPAARALAASLGFGLLVGCATPEPAPARPRSLSKPPAVAPRVSTVDDVRDCKLLSRLGSLGPRLGESPVDSLTRTRAEVLAKASDLRATHLVWGEAQFAYAPASAIAEAYRCAR